jgi:predicted dithiol-disulfide oxidoreductase (DUF899 family)
LKASPVVERKAWLDARLELLAREKALTRLRDEVAEARRNLPKVRVTSEYIFDSPNGELSLGDLFEGQSQLIVYHFMLGPEAKDPCKSCSFWAEQYDGFRVHLPRRDVNLVCVSRAGIEKIEEVKKKMGWKFPWVSSGRNTFNQDYAVTFADEDAGKPLYNFGTQPARAGESPGLSVFQKSGTEIFHTYSCYSRGLDALNGVYQLLDLVTKGRDESALPWPMAWLDLKYRY